MAKFGKKYRGILKALPKQAVTVEEAVKFIKAHPAAKFDETLDVSFRMGVDLVKSDSPVRGTVKLPAGSGKKVKVLVFAGGEHADEAKAVNAVVLFNDLVGNAHKRPLNALCIHDLRFESEFHAVHLPPGKKKAPSSSDKAEWAETGTAQLLS